MRKIVILFTFAAVAVACGNNEPPANPPPTPPTAASSAATASASAAASAEPAAPPKKPFAELQQATGMALFEALAAGDAKKAAAQYAKDATLKFAGAPDVTGRDAIEKSFTQFFASFSKIKLGESRVFVKDELVVSEWVMNATHSGEFMGNKASEKPVGWAGASVLWFNDDGLIKEEHAYWNPATVLFQIGAVKDKNRGVPALPSGKPEVVAAKNSDAEAASLEFMKEVNRAWENKNEADFFAMLTDASEWDDLTMAEAAKGKAGVQKYFKQFSTAFPDAKLTTINAWAIGDWVIEEGTYSGTNTGPLYGAPATKKAMTIHELNLVKLDKDDKIVKAITYGNDLEMTSQLNPPKAAPAKPAEKPAPKK